MVKLFRFREQSLWEAPVFYCNAPAALREPRLCGRGLCCHVVRAFVDVNQCRRGKKKSSRFWPTSCVLPPRLRDAAIRPGLFLKPPENTHFHRDLFSSFSAVRSLCPGIVRARQRPGDGGWGRVSAVEGVALCCVSVFKSVFQCVCEIGFVFIPSGFFVFFGDTWTQSGHKVYIFLSSFFFLETHFPQKHRQSFSFSFPSSSSSSSIMAPPAAAGGRCSSCLSSLLFLLLLPAAHASFPRSGSSSSSGGDTGETPGHVSWCGSLVQVTHTGSRCCLCPSVVMTTASSKWNRFDEQIYSRMVTIETEVQGCVQLCVCSISGLMIGCRTRARSDEGVVPCSVCSYVCVCVYRVFTDNCILHWPLCERPLLLQIKNQRLALSKNENMAAKEKREFANVTKDAANKTNLKNLFYS